MSEATAAAPPPTNTAPAYEAEHVHAVYDAIAPHFAATRYAPWPAVDEFLSSLPPYALIADIGCGNGKYMRVAQGSQNGVFAIGTDRCEELVQFAMKDKAELTRCDGVVGDVLALPFKAAFFDAAVNIAVVHHMATRERRVEAWKESLRVLKIGGVMLMYVWALERPEKLVPKRGNKGKRMLSRRFEKQDVFVPWNMRRRKEGATDDKILGDPMEMYRRFYHVYKEGELEMEIKESGGKVIRSYYDHQNWCAVVEKR